MNPFCVTALTATLALGPMQAAHASDDARAIVEAANTAWNQALNSGNPQALAALYTEDAIVSPGNGQTLAGRAKIEALFRGFVENGVHDHSLDIIKVGGSGKLIYQVARWSARGAAVDGKTPSFGGITSSVLEQDEDGTWRARSHVWNAGQ